MKKISFVAAVLTVTFMLSACNSKPQGLYDTLSRDQVLKSEQEPKTETVGVYLDTTPSMEGYVHGGDNNYYVLVLDKLKDVLAVRYEKNSIQYYRVDTPLWSTAGENVLEKGKHSEYYVNSSYLAEEKGYQKLEVCGELYNKGYDTSCLVPALEHAVNQDLSILITDFYDNTGNGDEVISCIKEMSLENDEKVFGLIGVRTGYQGTIHDAGPLAGSVGYGIEAPEPRQFFLILYGYPEEVKTAISEIKGRVGEIPNSDIETAVFYQEELYKINYTDFDGNGKNEEGLLWNEGVSVEVKDEEDGAITKIEAFKYTLDNGRNDEDGEIVLKYKIPDGHREKIAEIVTDDEYEVKNIYATRWNEETKKFEKIENSQGYFAIVGLEVKEQENILEIRLKINDDKLLSNETYMLGYTLTSSINRSKVDWCNEWSASEITDFARTERLTDYANAMSAGIGNINEDFLDGVLYIYTR